MSFARNNGKTRLFSGGFWVLFFSLTIILLLFLASVLLLVKKELVAYCRNDVTGRVEMYLEQRSGTILLSGGSSGGMQGLSFVRLIGENQQYFYSGNGALHFELEEIVNISPQYSASWVSVPWDSDNHDWTISSTEMGDGLIVQAGMRHPAIVDLYNRLRQTIFFMTVISFMVAAGLSFFCRRKSSASLREAEHFLARIVEGRQENLEVQSDNPDLDHMYQLLEKLISRNRFLIKEMQESLDNVAHDLRTPMTRLRSVAEYGLQQRDSEKLAEALSDCLEESERVLAMLGIMMSVVEAESGTMRLHREPVKLDDMLADVINLYEYVAEEKNISLEIEGETNITIMADPTRMTQVWANLVDNAIKYGKENGYVRISTLCSQESVAVLFKDNGIGISATEIERIWERLFRGDRSRSRPGLGLGLNYVRAMVEAHGGQIMVQSELGKGSLFEVRLPFAHDSFRGSGVTVKSQMSGEWSES
ncbi:MAG: HAMP domain-containing sensor histidine kinase [Desulfopila sp.]|jgi:signal transduction histidine kinase|nr:HAMP domain-containing sensor histidine kinase [Desulfopila sp.]